MAQNSTSRTATAPPNVATFPPSRHQLYARASAAVRRYRLRGAAAAVLRELVRRADLKTLACWPSVPTLAADTGLSERAVRYALTGTRTAAGLVPAGLVTVTERQRQDGGATSSVYTLTLPEVDAPAGAREPAQVGLLDGRAALRSAAPPPATVAAPPLQPLQPPPATIAGGIGIDQVNRSGGVRTRPDILTCQECGRQWQAEYGNDCHGRGCSGRGLSAAALEAKRQREANRRLPMGGPAQGGR